MRGTNQTRNILVGGIVSFLLLAAAISPAGAADGAAFDIKRLAVCENVQDREPVGVSETFSADTPRVYAFLEAVNIASDTEIDFVWFHGGSEMLRVTVPVKQGERWRTYANKSIYGLSGAWRVEIQDRESRVVGSAEFEVR